MNAAVIVLYRPDRRRLDENIDAIKGQVDKIILVDNGADGSGELASMAGRCNAAYIDNGGNKGIAHAMNRAVEYCLEHGYSWLLTLDQDSVCPQGIMEKYREFQSFDKVAVITCAINYNNKELQEDGKERFCYLKECITSASFIHIGVCREVGGFDEAMFIDRVDFEYCYRIRQAGYKILRANEVILSHQLGELEIVDAAFKKLHVGNHSAVRKYYMAQNLVYCTRKHAGLYSKPYCFYKLLVLMGKTIVFETDKAAKSKAILEGVKQGMGMKVSEDDWIKVKIAG